MQSTDCTCHASSEREHASLVHYLMAAAAAALGPWSGLGTEPGVCLCCGVIMAGELFDFDTEVEPLLEVLVGKVLEQALCEVLEEEELEAMRRHQAHFEAIR